MTVSELITKLQGLPQDATILGDKNNHDFTIPISVMGKAVVVASGSAYLLTETNSGVGAWIGYEPWRDEWAGVPLTPVKAVYIGSGDSIKTPVWQIV
jgi:hypothetical protein